MAKAKKLPSGSWRVQVYSHTEPAFDKNQQPIIDPQTGKQKMKRIYESFTSDDPSPKGKREAELLAAEFACSKEKNSTSSGNLTLRQAIDKYIEIMKPVLAKSTIRGYRNIQKVAFVSIMDQKLNSLSKEQLGKAVSLESKRYSCRSGTPISAKTIKNEYGLITATINYFYPTLNCTVRLPQVGRTIKTLPSPEKILPLFKGDRLELAVLLATWLSFSMSEIRGLTKSKSIYGDYIVIREVVVTLDKEEDRKSLAKTPHRNRMHHMPPYIKQLIDQVDGDTIVPYTAHSIYNHFSRVVSKAGLPHMTFHDLRHLNASVMAMLQIPEKYALDRGGWSTDAVMKQVYTHTFTNKRIEVDRTIDHYFESLLNVKAKKEPLPEEIIKVLQANNPDSWYDDLLSFMQHEIQHKKEEAP